MSIRLPIAPTAQNVPSVPVQSDPGVATDPLAFGSAVGGEVTQLGEGLQDIADRQLSRHEAIDSAHAVNDYNQAASDELLRLNAEQDVSRPGVMEGYGKFLQEQQDKILAQYGGRLGARAALTVDLMDVQARYTGQASALAVQAGHAAIERSLTEATGPLVAAAGSDPASIDDYLLQGERAVDRAAPALAPAAENHARAVVRDAIAGSAVDVQLLRGDVDGAERTVTAVGNALTPESRRAYTNQIGTMRAVQTQTEREIAVAEHYLGRPLTPAELSTKLGLAPRQPLVSIGPQVGQLPPGYRLTYDDQGRPVSMAPIPGSPAAAAVTQGEQQAAAGRQTEQTRAGIITRDTDRAIRLIDQGAGGALAAGTRFVPGTDAYNLDRTLDSIRSSVAFGSLQEMRAASPTGGALGQVSDTEERLLQSTRGSLDIAQDPKVLHENLATIRDLQLTAAYGTPEERTAAVAAGRLTQDQADQMARDREAAQGGGQQPAGNLPVVQDQAAYDKLPLGAQYRTTEGGEVYTKRKP